MRNIDKRSFLYIYIYLTSLSWKVEYLPTGICIPSCLTLALYSVYIPLRGSRLNESDRVSRQWKLTNEI